jgi:hypothetical protein
MLSIFAGLAGLGLFACEVRSDEFAPAPREAEVLSVMPREAKHARPNPSSVITTTIRDTGTYEAPLGKPEVSSRFGPLHKALDPARARLLEELMFEEELRQFELEHQRHFGHKGPETLKVEPRVVTPK